MAHPSTSFPVQRVRQDFPILHQEVHGKPLIYLDNAASTQQPKAVVEAMVSYAYQHHANVHRGVHALSQRATSMLEAARERVQRFIGATAPEQIIFTHGTTDSINQVAFGWALHRLGEGDEILLTELEHHANLIPWQEVAARTGATLKFLPVSPEDGQLDMAALDGLMTPQVRLVSVAQASNVTGEMLPIKDLIDAAHDVGAVAVIDGAQGVPHMPVDVAALGCDFYVFSGHKMCGPTGIGVLYGRPERLEEMAPSRFGGGMIDQVGRETSTYLPPPSRFEAGTPPIAAALGLAAAIDYLDGLGMAAIAAYEDALLQHMQAGIAALPVCRFLGPATGRIGVLSLLCDGDGASIHPFDVGQLLDAEGVAIRTGHHCAQPLMRRLGCSGTARASVAFYNTFDEIDAFLEALADALAMLQ